MPGGDRTGPAGQGPRTGRSGGGFGRAGGNRRIGGGFLRGDGGECICPKCGYSEAHQLGSPCNTKKCPKCGATMAREFD